MGKDNEYTEKLIREAAENIEKRDKDLKLSNTVLNAQVENKKRILEDLVKEITYLEEKRRNLSETIKNESKELLKSIDEKNLNSKERELKTKSELEAVTREMNFLEQEKSNVIGKRQELQNLLSQYAEKMELIKRFAESLK